MHTPSDLREGVIEMPVEAGVVSAGETSEHFRTAVGVTVLNTRACVDDLVPSCSTRLDVERKRSGAGAVHTRRDDQIEPRCRVSPPGGGGEAGLPLPPTPDGTTS